VKLGCIKQKIREKNFCIDDYFVLEQSSEVQPLTELRGRASNRLRAVAIAQFNDACVIKYWVLPDAKKQDWQ